MTTEPLTPEQLVEIRRHPLNSTETKLLALLDAANASVVRFATELNAERLKATAALDWLKFEHEVLVVGDSQLHSELCDFCQFLARHGKSAWVKKPVQS